MGDLEIRGNTANQRCRALQERHCTVVRRLNGVLLLAQSRPQLRGGARCYCRLEGVNDVLSVASYVVRAGLAAALARQRHPALKAPIHTSLAVEPQDSETPHRGASAEGATHMAGMRRCAVSMNCAFSAEEDLCSPFLGRCRQAGMSERLQRESNRVHAVALAASEVPAYALSG